MKNSNRVLSLFDSSMPGLDLPTRFTHDSRMTLTLHSPLDMHLHLRDEHMLKLVAPLSAQSFAGAVIMPNLVPPLTTPQAIIEYKNRIQNACTGQVFSPLMTAFFKPYTEAELQQLKEHIFGLKLYPAGATTNSAGGVSNMQDIEPTLAIMQDLQIPLLVHGETHGFVVDRETEFLTVYRHLATQFPKLTICMEHITTAGAIALLNEFENLCATVTLQHLLITLDDVIGGMMQPHLFCKPIAKTPQDRQALLQAVLSGHPRIMFGSDSAPHPIHAKECCGCAAGVFTAPIALPCLAQLFAEHESLSQLQAFVSDNACKLYHLTPPHKTIRLQQHPMQIPPEYTGFNQHVIPLFAGKTLEWSFA